MLNIFRKTPVNSPRPTQGPVSPSQNSPSPQLYNDNLQAQTPDPKKMKIDTSSQSPIPSPQPSPRAGAEINLGESESSNLGQLGQQQMQTQMQTIIETKKLLLSTMNQKKNLEKENKKILAENSQLLQEIEILKNKNKSLEQEKLIYHSALLSILGKTEN